MKEFQETNIDKWCKAFKPSLAQRIVFRIRIAYRTLRYRIALLLLTKKEREINRARWLQAGYMQVDMPLYKAGVYPKDDMPDIEGEGNPIVMAKERVRAFTESELLPIKASYLAKQ